MNPIRKKGIVYKVVCSRLARLAAITCGKKVAVWFMIVFHFFVRFLLFVGIDGVELFLSGHQNPIQFQRVSFPFDYNLIYRLLFN